MPPRRTTMVARGSANNVAAAIFRCDLRQASLQNVEFEKVVGERALPGRHDRSMLVEGTALALYGLGFVVVHLYHSNFSKEWFGEPGCLVRSLVL